MVDNLPLEQVVKPIQLLRKFCFDILNLKKDCFDVRKENKKVIKFHLMTGSKIVGETKLDYLFEKINCVNL